jgi:hypothetical protein
MHTRLLQRDEVVFTMMAHGVNVEIGDNNHLRAAEPVFRLEPRNYLSRQKVCADGDIRIIILQHSYEGTGIKLVKS